MRTPEFCSTCHKVALIPALNGYRWLRGQNHYDTWYDSGVSGRAVRSFYDPPKAKACRDCHLPDFQSAEFGNKNGYLHDHLFPAANTALPFIRQDAATQKRIEDFLKDKVLTVDLFAVRRENGELVVLGETPLAVRPGETLDVEVVVRTRGIGHPYTNGTADSNETWVSLEAAADGRGFFASGVLDEAGRLDAGADRLWTLVIDENGGHMDRRQPQDIRVPLYNNAIGPGAARVVHYRMTVPKDAKGPVTLSAGTHYRKFTRDYTTFSLGAAHPSLPVTTLASDAVTLAVGSASVAGLPPTSPRGNTDPLWLRWNDYGIGLFLQGDLKGAARRVDEGHGACARQAGRASQPRARRDRRGPAAGRQGVSGRGRATSAGLGQDGVLPRRRGQGRGTPRGRREGSRRGPREVSRRSGRLEQPRPRLLAGWKVSGSDRRLRQDPRDRSGRPERALQPDARLPRHRRPEERRDPRRGVPQVQGGRVDSRGPRKIPPRQPVRQPGVAADSRPRRGGAATGLRRGLDFVASIGPKGYETDHGYLTRAHPPVPSEQDQWSYVSAHRSAPPPSAPRVSSAP